MYFPKVSAYCATYGRPRILEEAIESFIRQDYKGEKELIILNDCPYHELYIDHPEVKVFNLKKKIHLLGEKFNNTIDLCSGEILFAWEDDDIYLPHRISYTINKMFENKKNIFHTRMGYVEVEKTKIISALKYWGIFPLFHSNLAIYKSAFKQAGGYLETDDLELDQLTINKFFKQEKYNSEKINLDNMFYIYRLNNNSYHAISLKTNLSKKAEDYVKNDNKIFGRYKLKPHWAYDYSRYVERQNNKRTKLFRPIIN